MEDKERLQNLINFCNVIRMQSILNKVHGTMKHNQYVLKIQEQENNNFIDLIKKSKLMSKINKSNSITSFSKSKSKLNKQQYLQSNSQSQVQSYYHTNNHKNKKKNNKFQKSTVNIKQKLPINNQQQYSYKKSSEKVEQMSSSVLSLKQLFRQEQILKDICQIKSGKVDIFSKATSEVRQYKSYQYLDKQTHRSQSGSPKNIINVKTPPKYQFTPIQQYQQLFYEKSRPIQKQKQINIVRNRVNIWPSRNKEDIIQRNQRQKSTKKSNTSQKKYSGGKNIKQVSESKAKKNINLNISIKQKKLSHNHNQQSQNMQQMSNHLLKQQPIIDQNGKVNKEKDQLQGVQHIYNPPSDQSDNENENELKESIKIPMSNKKNKKPITEPEKNKNKLKNIQIQQNIDINKLYIKCLGNKYLESIFVNHIPTNDK